MANLSVNLNAVAQLRNRRSVGWPSVTGMAALALDAGASGITVHPRPDERHIRRTDVYELNMLLRDRYPSAEFNIEGYPTDDFLALVAEIKPDQVTFVPDDPKQATSDHGWDVRGHATLLKASIAQMKRLNIRVALFIDEDPSVPPDAWEVEADRVELYTGPYAVAFQSAAGAPHLDRLSMTARAAHAAGLEVNVGHDLTLENLPKLVNTLPKIAEASIGHGLTADALIYGFAETVKRYVAALKPTR